MSDGLDFWESLEGMVVLVDNAVVVGPTNQFNETWVVGDAGSHATGINADGGVTIAPGDFNPERIQLQAFSGLVPNPDRKFDVGDQIARAKGVVSYAFGNYEIVLSDLGPGTDAPDAEPVTSFAKDASHLLIAGYNVENLDPKLEDAAKVADPGEIDDDVADGKFAAIASHIVDNLGAPDVVALQEVQDEDGSEMSDTVTSAGTLDQLLTAITQVGGPQYQAIDRPPVDDEEGGQPGGNIRVAFLFDPARVSVDEARVERLASSAFAGSRRPLAVPFQFNGTEVLVVNVHVTSRGGSDPLFGSVQPPNNGGEQERAAQAEAIRTYLASLPADPERRLVVLGDFNSFQFELPLLTLSDGGEPHLVNLTTTLPIAERRSYVFEGNAQALDHLLVDATSATAVEYEVLRLNSGNADQVSDHDPPIVRLTIPAS